MSQDSVVIVAAKRTPLGSFQGQFAPLSAPQLGSAAIRAALASTPLAAESINEVMMGCVLSAGIGQAPTRQATLGAGIPISTPATTISKVCGSGLKAVMLAHDMIKAGSAELIMAGGMESMTNAPYLLSRARSGYRLGHGQLLDHMFLDGLEDAYDKGKLMGTFAELCAEHYGFTRAQQDEFSTTSLERARQATADGYFAAEIVPVRVTQRGKETEYSTDEQPNKVHLERIPTLKPAFRPDGTVTAANSSSISDGAAALLLMSEGTAQQAGLQPLARIVAHTSFAHEPKWFTTAPVGAISALLGKTGWTTDDVDLYEINEAFAVVTMAAMHDLKLPADKVNIHGGACALGHPIGASGARILVTLIHALFARNVHKGIAALCIGGGEATAIAIERCH